MRSWTSTFLFLASTFYFSAAARGDDYYNSYHSAGHRHAQHHADLAHRQYHRNLAHADAHRYPMTHRQHHQLHHGLNIDARQDRREHGRAHRTGAYYDDARYAVPGYGRPRYSAYRYYEAGVPGPGCGNCIGYQAAYPGSAYWTAGPGVSLWIGN